MTLTELKTQAKAILEIPESVGNLTLERFRTNSGGNPSNKAGIAVERMSNVFKYRTTANGDAYSGCSEVLCENTGTKDADGKDVWRDKGGKLFVYWYRSGSPECFDHGSFREPNMYSLNS
jgi:hypothetical protein